MNITIFIRTKIDTGSSGEFKMYFSLYRLPETQLMRVHINGLVLCHTLRQSSGNNQEYGKCKIITYINFICILSLRIEILLEALVKLSRIFESSF